MDAWNQRRVAAGEETFDPTQLYQPRGVPDEAIGVVVDCSAVIDRKRAAILAHRSQAQDTGATDEEMSEALAREAFVIAWPVWAPGSPVVGDVFDDI
jgi:LmbE family N-acetylglucosaminyl deacetylase